MQYNRNNHVTIFFILCCIFPPYAWCHEEPSWESGDLVQLDIEDLMDIEVTSVSKKIEKRYKAAAAIFVLTQEEIHRSGASSAYRRE